MEKVTKWALASRLMVLVLQLVANSLITDHQPNVFRSPVDQPARTLTALTQHPKAQPGGAAAFDYTWLDRTVDFCLGGLRHWDGEYFLHIAEHTYSYENTLAFYPLYPLLVRTIAQAFSHVGLGLSLRSWNLLIAVVVNVVVFCKAANLLYSLTQRIFNDTNKSWNATLLFCFNPASIFFTAAYSETLFCCVSFYLMLECVSDIRFVRTTLALAMSMVARSNGLVNAAYPAYFILRKLLMQPFRHRLVLLVKLAACWLLALLPLTFFYFYAFQQFCQPRMVMGHSPAVLAYARERNYILAGFRQPENSPWCDYSFPISYSYIQAHYWNVGFLRYYEWKQAPNFLLALPILAFLYWTCWRYMRRDAVPTIRKHGLLAMLKELKSFPFVVHALFLTACCTFFVHIQIATRLLCSATPCLYWFAADRLPRTMDQIKLRTKASMILLWFGGYYLVGTVLFANNLPWT